MRALVAFALTCLVAMPAVRAQRLILPQTSPKASVMQTVGLTEITVTYNRPGVKSRTIWGDLVPYDEVWRVGANENTTISFSTPVRIGGKELTAGTYGLHMIPGKEEWTVIFSTNFTSWGSYFYDEKEDALRIKVKAEAGEFTERMAFLIANLKDDAADVVLAWEKLRVSFTVQVDVKATVVASIRKQLRSVEGFMPEALRNAALYCLRNEVSLDEGLSWIDRAIAAQPTTGNLLVKAQILEKQGDGTAVAVMVQTAVDAASSEADFNDLGYYYLNAKKNKEAIETFKRNARSYPKSWNAHDSLAEAYEKTGDQKLALEHYKKALELVNVDNQKRRIENSIKKLSESR